MAPVISLLAALTAAAPTPSAVVRFDGAAAVATVSARIVRASTGVGAGRPAPLPGMIARHATVTAADGRAVPALIYDFE